MSTDAHLSLSQAHIDALHLLADRAGLMVHWQDAAGQAREVEPATLTRVLETIGLPSATIGQCEASRAWLAADDAAHAIPPLVTAVAGLPISVHLPEAGNLSAYRIEREDGTIITGKAAVSSDGDLQLPPIDMPGYHVLFIHNVTVKIAVAPARCFSVADAVRARDMRMAMQPGGKWGSPHGDTARSAPWGIGTQLYALRRGAATGMGDFTALAMLCREAARAGADAVAINPVHAGFAALPERYSPYSPSSRLFYNPLYADPAATFGQQAVAAALAALGLGATFGALEARKEIDWLAVSRARYAVLDWLWHRRTAVLPAETMLDFAAFRARGGATLQAHARFEALQAHHMAMAPDDAHRAAARDWRQWPVTQRAPDDAAVSAFATRNADAIDFQTFLQWVAARGVAHAQQQARAAGMAIGLIADLAVGTDPGGSHAWSRQDEILKGVGAGAPPDLYNALGQGWGVSVFSPRGLRQRGYGAFIEMLRANFANAGGLRIDHALGLARMWLVPDGQPASTGAYMRFPIEDLLRLIALESQRHRAIVIGENLGTVPDDFNALLASRGVLGIDVLWFERAAQAEAEPAGGIAGGSHAPPPPAASRAAVRTPPPVAAFLPPAQWQPDAIATTTTHDLPTVAGWWAGQDIAWRSRLGQLAPGQSETAEMATRAQDRHALWRAWREAGLVSGDAPDRAHPPVDTALAWLARVPAPLRLVPIEDLLAEREQPNLPGTVDGHPNWQRRLDANVQTLFAMPPVRTRVSALQGSGSVAPATPAPVQRGAIPPTIETTETDMPDTTKPQDPTSAPEASAPARPDSTGTHAQDDKGDPQPQLPHESDEHHQSQQSDPRPEPEQARKDVEGGQEDTDLYGSKGKRKGPALP